MQQPYYDPALEAQVSIAEPDWRMKTAKAHTEAFKQIRDIHASISNLIPTLAKKTDIPTFQKTSLELSASGTAPLILAGLPGVSAANIFVDVWANLPVAGTRNVGDLFYATDRTVLYVVELVGGANTWVYILGTMQGTRYPTDQRPSGLGTNDTGFLFNATDQNELYRWSGTAWMLYMDLSFVLYDTHPNRTSSGTVDTAGTSVTWDTGDKFDSSWVGHTIIIGGVAYIVATVPTTGTMTLTTGAGTQTGVAYAFSAYPATSFRNGVEYYETDRTLKYIAADAIGTADIMAGGTVNATNAAVTWVSGDKFDLTWTGNIVINGLTYTISSVNSTTSITLTSNVTGSPLTGVTYYKTGANGTFLLWDSGPLYDPYWAGAAVTANGIANTIAQVIDTKHLNMITVQAFGAGKTITLHSGQWLYETGIYINTLANIPTLASNDANFLLWISDYSHLMRWDGAAWNWGPADQGSGYYQLYESAPSGFGANAWQLCNGSTVARLNSDATTTNVTLDDLTTAAYLKGATTSAAVAAASGTTDDESSHTHPVNITSGVDSAPVTFGTGNLGTATAAAEGHTHQVTGNTGAGTAHHHGPGTLDLRNKQARLYYRR